MPAPDPVEFVPIGMLDRPDEETPAAVAGARSGFTVERLPAGHGCPDRDRASDGTRARVDAFVNEKALSRILRAMKGAV